MALVTGSAKTRLQITDINGKNLSLAPRNVIICHPGQVLPVEFQESARDLEGQIVQAEQDVDPELLWASVDKDGKRSYAIEELAKEYFGEDTSVFCSAIFRVIFADRVRFKLKGLSAIPRTEEQVAAQLHALQVRHQKEELARVRDRWLQELLDADEPVGIPPELEDFVADVEAFLLQRQPGAVEPVLRTVSSDFNAKEAAFEILVRCGRLPEQSDPLLIIGGIEEHFSDEVLAAAVGVATFVGSDEREDYCQETTFSIDDSDTREIDDAVTVRSIGEGLQVAIHIADVASYVSPADPLFEEALRRTSTLYLPNRIVTMLPDRLSFDLASLRQDEVRPAFTFLIDFSADGEITDYQLQRSVVKITHRLTYEDADAQLAAGGRQGDSLERLDQLTQQLARRRLEQGALLIRRPEIKIRVDSDGQIEVKRLDLDTPSRRIVSELMIVANHVAALFAQQHSIPFLYRTQAAPDQPVETPDGYDPVQLDALFRQLKKSQFEAKPAPHASLGMPVYTQATSPIRRLIDLVAQQQLAAVVEGRPPPHLEEDLSRIHGAVRVTGADLRAVSRKSERLYLLRYLERQDSRQPLEAIVLRKLTRAYLVETTDLLVRGKLLTQEELAPGAHVMVKIDRIDPEENVLLFRAD